MNISNHLNGKPINLNKVNIIKTEVIEGKDASSNKTDGPTYEKRPESNQGVQLTNEQILLNNGIKIVSSSQTGGTRGTQGSSATRGSSPTNDVEETGNVKDSTLEMEEVTEKDSEYKWWADPEISGSGGTFVEGAGAFAGASIGFAVGGPVGAVVGMVIGGIAGWLAGKLWGKK